MNVGHAILTQGKSAWLRLQLAAAARHWTGGGGGGAAAPTFVYHDGPDEDFGNRAVAGAAGAAFVAGAARLGYRAINPGIAAAVRWAAGRGLDALAVHGRRWVPLWDVSAGMLAGFGATGLPMLGNTMADVPRRPHARNEFFACRPDVWVRSGAVDELTRDPGRQEDVMFPLHRAAAIAAGVAPSDWRRVLHPWPAAIGRARHERPNLPTLWSFWTTPCEYAAAAAGLGLSDLGAADFVVPGCRQCGGGARAMAAERVFDLKQPPARFAVVTLFTPDIADMGRVTSAAAMGYALRHGYAYTCHAGTLDPTRPPPWSKLLLILRAMDDGRPGSPEWVLWLDADALVTNPAARLESLATPDDADLVITEDVTKTSTLLGINTGAWMLRNCPATRRMIREALGRHDLNEHGLWEQQAVREWLRDNPGAVRVRIVPPKLLNSSPRQWTEGDFVCHFYGMPNHLRLAGVLRGRPSPDDVSYYRPDVYAAAAVANSLPARRQ